VYSGHSPPPCNGRKRHFLEFGEENRPLEKKISEMQKLQILLENLFSITTLALKSNT
jgi:hypothetical protein